MKLSSHFFTIFGILITLGICITGCQPSGDQAATAGTEQTFLEKDSLRIVSLSGFLTELLYTLDAGNLVVGTDITSTYPPEVNKVKKLGHISQLNPEGILSLEPDVILAQADQIKQSQALTQLQGSSVDIIPVHVTYHLNNALKAAEAISQYIPISKNVIPQLKQNIIEDSIRLRNFLLHKKTIPSVLFIYARGAGNLMVAGNNTSAQAIIEKAGGKNAITSFDQFRALTPEALINAAPDVILMFDSGLASLNGKEGLKDIPGMQQTPAFRNDRIITMDGHLLTSFGPRAGEAALELAKLFYDHSPKS